MKSHLSLRSGLLSSLVLAAAIALLWPTAGVSTNCTTQTIRTLAAAQQTGVCSSSRVCEEWVRVCDDGTETPLGIFCCSNGLTCVFVDPGVPF